MTTATPPSPTVLSNVSPSGATLHLSQTQTRFVHDSRQFTAMVAGRGSGKTVAGAAKAMVGEFGRPGLGIVVAPTYPMLRDATLRTCLSVWAPLLRDFNQSEMRAVIRGGHEVLFRSADDPDRLRGPSAAWAWIDEAAQCHPDTWPVLLGVLRSGGKLGRCWVTTTPVGMNWVYDVFVTNANDDTAIYRASTASNPFVEPAFADALRSQYTAEFARQELDGEFITMGQGLFPPRWWQRIGAVDRAHCRSLIQVWDTAFSEKTSADYSVCATWAATDTGYVVLDVWRAQVGFPALKRAAVDLFAKWKPEAVLVEDKASGQSLIQELRSGTRIPVLPVAVDRDKLTRANAITAHCEAGKVAIPEAASWVRDWIDEHAAFPHGTHDDQVDTTVMALHRLARGSVLPFSWMRQ